MTEKTLGHAWGILGQKRTYENRLSSYDVKIETFVTH